MTVTADMIRPGKNELSLNTSTQFKSRPRCSRCVLLMLAGSIHRYKRLVLHSRTTWWPQNEPVISKEGAGPLPQSQSMLHHRVYTVAEQNGQNKTLPFAFLPGAVVEGKRGVQLVAIHNHTTRCHWSQRTEPLTVNSKVMSLIFTCFWSRKLIRNKNRCSSKIHWFHCVFLLHFSCQSPPVKVFWPKFYFCPVMGGSLFLKLPSGWHLPSALS